MGRRHARQDEEVMRVSRWLCEAEGLTLSDLVTYYELFRALAAGSRRLGSGLLQPNTIIPRLLYQQRTGLRTLLDNRPSGHHVQKFWRRLAPAAFAVNHLSILTRAGSIFPADTDSLCHQAMVQIIRDNFVYRSHEGDVVPPPAAASEFWASVRRRAVNTPATMMTLLSAYLVRRTEEGGAGLPQVPDLFGFRRDVWLLADAQWSESIASELGRPLRSGFEEDEIKLMKKYVRVHGSFEGLASIVGDFIGRSRDGISRFVSQNRHLFDEVRRDVQEHVALLDQ